MGGKKSQRPVLDRVRLGGKRCGMEAGQVSPDSRASVLENGEKPGHAHYLAWIVWQLRLALTSSGQMRCQSSGRISRRVTAPWV